MQWNRSSPTISPDSDFYKATTRVAMATARVDIATRVAISPDSDFYKAFTEAFGPLNYGDPDRKTAAERFGNGAGATSATDKVFYADAYDKTNNKYARAKKIDLSEVKGIRVSPLFERRALNAKTYRYKYYDYNLPKNIYTDKSLMYN